jgi:hypothetical protein
MGHFLVACLGLAHGLERCKIGLELLAELLGR